MEALGASHLKFFLSRQREGQRKSVSRHEFGCVLHQKLVLFRANCVASISTQTKLESEAIQPLNLDQPKTVRVRFKLRKQCAFGQQFLVVGDDPNLGSWEPSGGVPLNWSEGHVWTADVDVPCGEVVTYKFVLQGIDGTMSWQPGPDRVLETWDAAKTISVSGDWDIPVFQSVVEEEEEPVVVAGGVNESSSNDLGLLIGEHWDQMDDSSEEEEEEEEVCGEISSLDKGVVEKGSDLTREEIGGDDSDDEPSLLMVAENISLEQDSVVSGEEKEEMALLENETRVVRDEGVPVLVPGLGALPLEEVEEAETSIIDRRSTTDVCGEILEAATTVFNEIEDSTDLNDRKVVEAEDSADLNPRDNDVVAESDANEAPTETEIHVSVVVNGGKSRILDKERNDAAVVEDPVVEDATDGSDPNEAATEPEICVSAVLNGEKNRILDKKRNDVVEDNATQSDQIEHPNEAATEPEIRVSAALHRAETSEVTEEEEEEKPRLDGAKKQILENDMKWGIRALNKFLANLGFMQHS